ncbi:hypothetical protein HDV00_002490 [Rhizophlyctis rosea]|nr:hypothetical protein HDV00_002490 [Rhizophlyctis rosea]
MLMLSYFSSNPSVLNDVAVDPTLTTQYPNFWSIVNLQTVWAVPQRYPLSNLPVESRVLKKYPIRMLLAETLVKNITIEEEVDRVCIALDYSILHTCGVEDLELISQGCGRTRQEVWEFVYRRWDEKGQYLCRIDYTINPPDPVVLPCPYIPHGNSAGVAIYFFAVCAIVFLCGCLFLLFRWRKRPAIASASYELSSFMVAGAIVSNFFPLLSVGAPTTGKCIGRVFMVVLGFSMLIGGLIVRLTQMYRKGTDLAALSWLVVIVLINLGLLAWWALFRNPGLEVMDFTLPNYPYDHYTWPDCSNGYSASIASLMVGNSIFAVYGMWFAIQIHMYHGKCSSVIRGVSYSIVFLSVIPVLGLAIGDRLNNPGTRGGFQSALIILGSVGACLIYLVPKLLRLDEEEVPPEKQNQYSSRLACNETGPGKEGDLPIGMKKSGSVASGNGNGGMLRRRSGSGEIRKSGGKAVSIEMISSKPMSVEEVRLENGMEKADGEGGS